MERKTLVKPRKVVWVMRDFINTASDLEHILEADFDGENYSNVIKAKRTVKLKQGKHFSTYVCDPIWKDLEEFFTIFYNVDDLYGYTMKEFRKDFVSRCSMARGFANVTLTLLHELGHQETNVGVWSIQDRNTTEAKLAERFEKGEIDRHQLQVEYFRFPDETLATNWAIEWLKDAEHRKIAKKFEKEFFKCFK